MTDEIEDDTHDKLLKHFIEYSRWSERFEIYGYNESAIRARESLLEVGRLIKKRRDEIQAKRKAIIKARKIQKSQKKGDHDDT
jgi:hypothetical protein